MNPALDRTVATILAPLGPSATPELAAIVRAGVTKALAECPDAVGLKVDPQYDDRHRIGTTPPIREPISGHGG
jgi:hypothetical protein